MNRRRRQQLLIVSILGYLITAVAVILVPVIAIVARDRSDYFWYKIVWTEFLTLLVWVYFGSYLYFITPGVKKPARFGGILPPTGFVVLGYAIFSFILIIIFDWPSSVHWVAQAILLVATVLLLVFLKYIRYRLRGAFVGTEPMPEGISAPHELAAMLRLHEDRFWIDSPEAPSRKLSEALKILRETLQYSLPDVGRIGETPEYQKFAEQTEMYCSDLQNVSEDSDKQEEVEKLQKTAIELKSQAEQVSLILKSRP